MSAMNYLDFALVFFLLLVLLNYRAHHSVLYPPFIFSVLWLLDLAVVRSGLIEINPVHGNTLAIVAAGATSFSAGGLLASIAPQALLRIHLFPPKPNRTTDLLSNMLMTVLFCGLPVMFYQTLQFSKSLGGNYLVLAQAREVLVEASQSGEKSEQMILLSYFVKVATYTCLLFAIDKKGWKFWVVAIVAFVACILSTGRTDLLFFISGLSAIYLLQRKQESLCSAMRVLRWPMILFAVLWTGLEFANKSPEGVTGGVTVVATHYALVYISGPLAAFDRVVQQPAEFMMATSHAFRYPLKLAAALHLTNHVEFPPFDSFVPVPFPINVYTVFKYDFLELGTFGTLALLLFVGLLQSFLYLKAKQGGRFSTYLFASTIYAVLMVIFDDEYFLTGLNPQATIFGLLYFFIGSVEFRLFAADPQRVSLSANRR